MRRVLLVVCVILGSTLLTTLAIDASQFLASSSTSLTGAVANHFFAAPACDAGMTQVPLHNICIDTYEAGVGTGCIIKEPLALHDTAANIGTPGCVTESLPRVLPWRFVSYHQAAQLCALSGKRLPTLEEWYAAALGTRDSVACFGTQGQLARTGSQAECRSGIGVYDMVGNVWEYVSETTIDDTLLGNPLPPSGYVSNVTPFGVVTHTSTTPERLYQNDYAWSDSASGSHAVLRGGFYGSGEDGGLYSIQSEMPTNFGSVAIGFRCVSDRM